MRCQKVVSYKNLPSMLPFRDTAIAWLMLDRFHAPGWAWGAVGALGILVWAACLFGCARQETVDIFKTHSVRKDYE